MRRREVVLASSVMVLTAASGAARSATLQGGSGLPWKPFSGDPPAFSEAGGWTYFTPDEVAAVEALVDRLIPPDPTTPGGKDCGCAVYIDRQLAGPYGSASGQYMAGPFPLPEREQRTLEPTLQLGMAPAELYRRALVALDAHSRSVYGGQTFAKLLDDQKDHLVKGMENGSLALSGIDSQVFFTLLLQNTREGFFADPIYGGNRNMAAWKMIGFPGARYDYRDWVERHNERYPHQPMSIADR